MSKFAHLRFIQLSLMNTSAQLVKVLFISVILISSMYNSLYSQNLVPNPSFEDTLCCPSGQCQLPCANGWFAIGASPDYYHACSNNYSVPTNPSGFQYAHTGIGYAGLSPFNNLDSAREYIGAKLTEPLTPGASYYVEFWTSLSDNPTIGFACDGLGILLSTSSYEKLPCIHSLNYYPSNFSQIFSPVIIQDTSNWVQVSGTFIADSAYRYVNIGNFFFYDNTNCVTVTPNFYAAYYFIDDIYVGLSSQVGIGEQKQINPFIINPNPADQYLSITRGKMYDGSLDISLYNSYGVNIKTITMNSAAMRHEIMTATLPSGIYYIVIIQDQFVTTEAIIIQH